MANKAPQTTSASARVWSRRSLKIRMNSSVIKIAVLMLLILAFFVAFLPIGFVRGTDPDFQQYQEAKGSSLPSGYAHSHLFVFLKIAGILAGVGSLMVLASLIVQKNEERIRKKRIRSKQAEANR